MDIITWNCQGAASKEFIRTARLLLKSHKPQILALLETKTSRMAADSVCKKLGYSNWVRVEAVGFSGGIWILWGDDLNLEVRFTHPQFVILNVNLDKKDWNLVIVYASPSASLRKRLWEDLNPKSLNLLNAWIACGDFNAVRSLDEVSNPLAYT